MQCKQALPEKKNVGLDTICDELVSKQTNLGLDLSFEGPAFVEKAQAVINDIIKKPVAAYADTTSYRNNAEWEHVNFDFSINGIPLCQFYARISVSGDRTLVKGVIPENINFVPVDQAAWDAGESLTNSRLNDIVSKLALGELNVATPTLRSSSKMYTSTDIETDVLVSTDVETEVKTVSITNAQSNTPTDVYESRCLIYDPSKDKTKLFPGWEIHFSYNNLPYTGLVAYDHDTQTNVIYKAVPNYFSEQTATYQTTTYQKTPLNSTNLVLTTKAISGMSAGGSLCSARFKVVIDNPPTDTKIELARASDNQYKFEPSDHRFNQTSVFTNATLHSDWFLQIAKGTILKSWPAPRIELWIDYKNLGVNNSAVYIPQDLRTGQGPHIGLGNGNGVILKNLQIDSDAVYHEVGHHVVYQTLKTTSGDSLVIHEGLADFFVSAHTNSPCLGNLICPKGGTLCVSNQCLRSANNTWSYTDPNLPTDAHQESQFISGLMWSIGKKIGLNTTTSILLKAIEFFPVGAGFPDLVQALMESDKTLNKGVNACAIQAEAYKRGLKDEMSVSGVPDCKTYGK